MRSPTFALAAGLATLAVAGALTPFALIGLLGLILFVGGIFLVAKALLADQSDQDGASHGLGTMVAAWGGAAMVAASAFRGGSLAFATTLHRLHPGAVGNGPSISAWLAGAAMACVGAALLSAGLRRYPSFETGNSLGWFIAGFAMFPAAVILFFALSSKLPVTA